MDHIQQKLAAIDKQLAEGKADSFRKIAISSPLLFCAVGLIVGIIIQNVFTLSIFLWLVLLILCVAGLIAFFIISKTAQKYLSYDLCTYLLCTSVCFICLGAVRLINFQQPASNNIRNFIGEERQLATVRGTILTEPYAAQPQWEFSQFAHIDLPCSFYLKAQEIQTADGWAEIHGTIRVQVDEPVLNLKTGDLIEAYCWLNRFSPVTNPGQFDIEKYMVRNNVFIAASVESRNSITVLENRSTATLTKIKQRLTEIAMTSLLDSPRADEQNQKLLEALVLGYKSNIDSDIFLAFRKTGLLHFICLSGMNFGIVIGIVWWFCRIFGLMKPARAAICVIAAVLFLLVIPPQAPAFRAAIMCFVFCASFFFRRKPNSLNSLSLAAVILLLINPMQLYDIGWQLSFAAVLGILLFTERITFFFYEKITSQPWTWEMPKTNLFFRIVPKLGSFLLNCFSISLAAYLATSGIMLYHFYTINVFTTLWTVIVSPLIAAVSVIGYLKMALGLLLPYTASFLGIIVLNLSDWLIWTVKFLAALDKFNILTGHVPLAFIIFCYACVFFVAFVHFRRPKLKVAIISIMLLTIIVYIGAAKFQRTYHNNLVVTCLDVGHGQAIIAQLPGNKTYLFDAGSQNRSDIGTRIIGPFLNYNGIRKLDAIFISHGDIDHINGIPEVVKLCKVNAVYADETFISINKPTVEFLRNWLTTRGLKIKTTKDDTISGIKFLWPNNNVRTDGSLSKNDKAAVSLIESGHTKILLCSDIEKFAQANLLKLFPNLRPDVVVVPHHGSLRTRLPDFLSSLSANVLIYSCGQSQFDSLRNAPSPAGAKSFYTCADGAIDITVSKKGTIETAATKSK